MSTREVELTEGAPWGFRMHGGVDQNQPLRISRVNPGRKASLSGIREGDIITSINGRTTKEMSNADAHAMLRSAGPVLRLGLNEDREMSPRRRSIGKATELKRPFQLIDITEKAIPHPPVYATIRQPNSPNKLPSKPLSTQPTLHSTHLVKSFEDSPKFHPTNPFYSTLPNTKLPIPNGKSNSLQRSVNRTDSYNDDLRLSSFFRKNDSGPNISNNKHSQSNETSTKQFLYDKFNSYPDKEFSNGDHNNMNPFGYVTNENQNSDKSSTNGAKNMIYSKSDNNFHRNDEIIKHTSIIEQKISETEEIKTVKKLMLNGPNDNDKTNGIKKTDKLYKFHSDHNINERIIPTTLENEDILKNKFECTKNGEDMVLSPKYPRDEYKVGEAQSGATPPAQSPSQVTAQGIKQDSGSCSNENRDIPDGSIVRNETDNSALLATDNSSGSQSKESTVEQLNKNEDNESIKKVEREEIDVSEKYIVETPEQTSKPKAKLDISKKSKSCDDDDSPKIVEVTEEYNSKNDHNSIPIIDSNKVIVTTEESEVEWENTEEFNLPQAEKTNGILSNNYTISLDMAHCEQTKSLSPEEESSLRNYLHTLNLSTNPNIDTADIKTEIEQIINREIKYRLRRKGLAEDTFFERSGASRSLAVIDEEGSGDSSKTSRRQSYLSDKKSDTEELEDEVFETKDMQAKKRRDTNFPTNLSMRRTIPQQCIRVDAKLKEPEVSEARGDWKMETIEKITGAELVYLTDSSSSTSSIYDISDEGDKGHETDASVRMITPTIEVTDTESLLKNTFLSKCNEKNINKTNESTIPINNEREDTKKTEQKSDLLMNVKSTTEIDKQPIKDPHEIIVLSTDDIKTNLFVKDINEISAVSNILSNDTNDSISKNNITLNKNSTNSLKEINNYDLEIKVLKCELNDAINNLIKEVVSDSENTSDSNGTQDTVKRQDSSSSLDSSQCTAKYNPTYSSLNDVSSFLRNESHEDFDKETPVAITSSHVKDVIEHVEHKIESKLKAAIIISQPYTLRNICLKKISSLPYGEKVLEELANVSKRLQDISVSALNYSNIDIQQVPNQKEDELLENQKSSGSLNNQKENKHVPPPVKPRKSSLKKGQDDQRFPVPPKPEKVYECLSPSQKMLMEKTNTVIRKDDIIKTPKTHTEERNSINKENNSSVLPMKSETGSRLLALLRSSPAPRKSSLPTLNDENYFSNSKTNSPRTESFSKRLLKEIDESNNFKEPFNSRKYQYQQVPVSTFNFKPIPPPQPRKVFTYESDSEFTDSSYRSMRSDKKVFHYSTGNLNEEIENDISSIQNLHRQCTNIRNKNSNICYPRRPSLPKDLCDQQMEYIRQKEKEVEAEIRRLEQEQHKTSQRRGPRAPMISEKDSGYGGLFETKHLRDNVSNYTNSTNMENRKISSQFSSSQEELLREKMYTEYVNQMAEREQRKHNKVIKVTQSASSSNLISKSMPTLNYLDSKVNNRIEQEFISKAKERWYKLGIRDSETEDEQESGRVVYREPKVIEHKIKVIEDGEEKDVKKLPSHMQEFVRFTVKDKDGDTSSNGESESERAPPHVVVFCAVFILVLAVGKFLLRLLRNK